MAWSFLDDRPPYGFAHRGGTIGAPENTVAAFAAAVELGYSYLETDVHRTSDGVIVAFHDDQLERVAGLPGQIGDYTWDRLSEVRLGGAHPIPRLTDLLETFPDAMFNIDPKADDSVDGLIEIIKRFDAVDRVCVGSFSDARIAKVQAELGPTLCTSPGPRGVVKVLLAAILGLGWQPPYACIQIPTSNYGLPLDSAWLIGRVKKLGLQVHFWTINDEAEMRRLLDRGADAIITDEIEILKRVLEDRGEWS